MDRSEQGLRALDKYVAVMNSILLHQLCLITTSSILLWTIRLSRADNRENTSVYTSHESELLGDLLARYHTYKTLARPVLNSSNTIVVRFGITLVQILDLDEKNQMLTTLVWKEYRWEDEILSWDPEEYGGVDIVRLPGDKIWTPDIILYNNIGSPDVEQHKDLLLISYNGTIVWVPPVIYRSSCPVDMTNYPFDQQTCNMRFGSWTYDIKRLDPMFRDDEEEMSLSGYIVSSEWDIVSNVAQKHVVKYSCCDKPYADLTFNLTLKRRVTFHMKLILIPTVLLSVMSVFIFWIPPNRPDRTGLGLSLFTSFFLLLILLVNTSPPTPSAKLGQYCCVVILMVALGLLISIININISQFKSSPPIWVEMIFIHFIGSCRSNKHKRKRSAPSSECQNGNTHSKSLLQVQARKEGGVTTTVVANPGVAEALLDQPDTIEDIELDIKSDGEKWYAVALVLDRVFFCLFLAALFLAYIFTFPEPLRLFSL